MRDTLNRGDVNLGRRKARAARLSGFEPREREREPAEGDRVCDHAIVVGKLFGSGAKVARKFEFDRIT